ncbi:hypothetical protein STANM309S_05562 [Streptomyces tanashiensis]
MSPTRPPEPPGDDTLDLRVEDLVALLDGDLLDSVAAWGPAGTPVGSFGLVPVRLERDLPLLTRWMNDPAVAAFWELARPDTVTADHVRAQLEGDGRSVPCLGVLDGTPMSYFEIYRADLDPLARYYPARPHDTGIHLLIGGDTDRGRGVGTHTAACRRGSGPRPPSPLHPSRRRTRHPQHPLRLRVPQRRLPLRGGSRPSRQKSRAHDP